MVIAGGGGGIFVHWVVFGVGLQVVFVREYVHPPTPQRVSTSTQVTC